MEEFILKTKQEKNIPIYEGIPAKYNNYAVPNMQAYYAQWGEDDENTCIFQIRTIGLIEIVYSHYITPGRAVKTIQNHNRATELSSSNAIKKVKKQAIGTYAEILCTSDAECIELHTMLQGDVEIELNGFNRRRIKSGLYNLIYLPGVDNHTWFYEPLTITFDLHIPYYVLSHIEKKSANLKAYLKSVSNLKEASIHPEYGICNAKQLFIMAEMQEMLSQKIAVTEDQFYPIIKEYINLSIIEPKSAVKVPYTYNTILEVREYEKHIRENLEDQEIIIAMQRKFGILRKTLLVLFKLFYQTTPKHYHLLKNLELVKKKLGLNYSLKDSINGTRFRSVGNMNRAFYNVYGITTEQYSDDIKKKDKQHK